MIKLDLEDTQLILKKPIERNITALGLDVATRTGWCIISTTTKELLIDYGFINVKSKDPYFKYNEYIDQFYQLIKANHIVIIEDSFLRFSVWTLKVLAKLEGIAYCVARIKKVKKNPIFIMASTARKNIGINGVCKKPQVKEWLKDKLNIDLEDEDAADAVVLAINGIIHEQ